MTDIRMPPVAPRSTSTSAAAPDRPRATSTSAGPADAPPARQRSTSTSRTAAATRARLRAYAARQTIDVIERLPMLDDATLERLIRAAWSELEVRYPSDDRGSD